MKIEKAIPPVIIIGMHRSGTTQLVRMMNNLGFFAGTRLGENMESRFFIRINEWIMRRAGGAWDYPLPTKELYRFASLRAQIEKSLARSVRSWRFSEYTGSFIDIFSNAGYRLRKPWGWKDPRMVFTARLWLNIFPDAKLLYIKRNGVDVANSLFVRANRSSQVNNGYNFWPLKTKMINIFQQFEPYGALSLRCTSLKESFSLWEEYIREAEELFDWHKGLKMSFRYEDLIANPYDCFREIALFSALETKTDAIKEAVSTLKTDRVFAFTKSEHLWSFYEEVKDSEFMKRLGYHDVC